MNYLLKLIFTPIILVVFVVPVILSFAVVGLLSCCTIIGIPAGLSIIAGGFQMGFEALIELWDLQ